MKINKLVININNQSTCQSRCEIPGLNGTDSFSRNDLSESSWISDYIPFKDSKIDTCHVYTTPGAKNGTVTCDSYVYSDEYFDKTIVTEVRSSQNYDINVHLPVSDDAMIFTSA
mgnify:CR=1 FL=1